MARFVFWKCVINFVCPFKFWFCNSDYYTEYGVPNINVCVVLGWVQDLVGAGAGAGAGAVRVAWRTIRAFCSFLLPSLSLARPTGLCLFRWDGKG